MTPSNLGDAWFGLTILHTQRGDAGEALTAAREGLQRPLTPAQQSFLTALAALVEHGLSV
jgi:hypothetical protein